MSHRERDSIVIVGGGVAAAAAAFAVRDLGYAGQVTLLTDEPALPYRRRLLATRYLRGEIDRDELLVAPANAYGRASIDVLLGAKATALDPVARRLLVRGHGPVAYSRLILASEAATTARGDADFLFTLSRSSDVDTLRAAARSARRAVVVGGGLTGTEAAASLRSLGLEVVLVGRAPVLVPRLGAALGRWLRDHHVRGGIEVLTGEEVTAIDSFVARPAVRTSSGRAIDADVVVLTADSAGPLAPALEAGLHVEGDGVPTSAAGATSVPDILVAGDRARPLVPGLGHVGTPSDDFAWQTARIAAAGALGLTSASLRPPTLSSEQGPARLDVVGFPDAADRVLEMDATHHSGWWAYVRNEKLVAVSAVNRADVIARVPSLLGSPVPKRGELLGSRMTMVAGLRSDSPSP